MKKARARAASPSSNAYWDKKLLEVEAKDPNRWRHSGYKSLYIDGSSSPSPGRRRTHSRSPTASANRRSPVRRSPMGRRSPAGGRRSPRSPAMRGRSPRRRSPVSPPSNRRSPVSRRSPPGGYRSPIGRRSPASAPRRNGAGRSASPPPQRRRRSASASSISSCSDDSCSVCSPKNHRRSARSRSRSFSVPRSRTKEHHARQPPEPKARARPARPPSPSPMPQRRAPRPTTPPPPRKLQRLNATDRPTDPRRQPPPPRPRARTGEVIDVTGVKLPPKPVRKVPKDKGKPVLLTRVKKEKKVRRPGSPGESSESEDSSNSSVTHIVATTSLTLSERFGKIAQWSADRERREMENMRITKTGGDLKVMIEEDDFLYGSPPPRRYSLSPVPAGHYPDELLSSGQSRLAAWDDVRVRYQYYKDLGYLRDLSLEDYVKWEEWWYKYQDWLANERHYEHWARTQSGSRRRRKRLPASQRLN